MMGLLAPHTGHLEVTKSSESKLRRPCPKQPPREHRPVLTSLPILISPDHQAMTSMQLMAYENLVGQA